ncbi:hypothetical protein MHU86_13160 [Fragilaria crotonensis]|nr:hypothetical protein MHU86_13160 [Fragilaria crotonensis]
MHFQRSPLCLEFVRREQTHPPTAPIVQHCANATFDDTVFTTTKRPRQLRCEIVNDISRLAPPSLPFAALPNLTSEIEEETILDDMQHDIQILVDDTIEETSCPMQHDTIASSQSFMFSTDQKWTISLLKILDDINAPDYAFESVLKWARNAQTDGYSFYPDGGQSRMKNVDVLFKSVTNAQKLLPSVLPVNVPHGPPCEVIAYEFALSYSICYKIHPL